MWELTEKTVIVTLSFPSLLVESKVDVKGSELERKANTCTYNTVYDKGHVEYLNSALRQVLNLFKF